MLLLHILAFTLLFLLGKTGLKFLHAPGGINHLVTAGVKWVAMRTDFHLKTLFGGTNDKRIAACATHLCLIINRM